MILADITPEKISQLPPDKRRQAMILVAEHKKRTKRKTVFGIVHPERGHTHSITQGKDGQYITTGAEPDLYIPAKLERLLTTKARQIFIFGGRGSGKSIGVGDIVLCDAKDNMNKTFCLREFQSSISDSVHALLCSEIDRLELEGFEYTQNSITLEDAQVFSFKGISRNPSSIKSSFGFRNWVVEEAQFLSEESLEILLPSARKKPNKGLPKADEEMETSVTADVRLIFIANLGSMEDPFTKRVQQYLPEVEVNGYYEDDLRLIIKMNYSDNPWFVESGMDRERLEDKKNMPAALYEHIWEGATNDSVENALVMAEWFDACIDAHKKLGFQAKGAKIAAHDPSDLGEDSKGYCMRHGSVVQRIEEKIDGNVNEGGHWACDMAIEDRVDYYTWDVIGMGAGLVEQTARDLEGKKIDIVGFHSAESPDRPLARYKPAKVETIRGTPTNQDVFKNKGAQYAFELRDRIYRTYLAVTQPEVAGYQDPDTLISFCSEIPLLAKLRAEVCRIPTKPNRNGLLELYTKPEMKRLYRLKSPNLFDSLKMTMRYEPEKKKDAVVRPPVIKRIGAR